MHYTSRAIHLLFRLPSDFSHPRAVSARGAQTWSVRNYVTKQGGVEPQHLLHSLHALSIFPLLRPVPPAHPTPDGDRRPHSRIIATGEVLRFHRRCRRHREEITKVP